MAGTEARHSMRKGRSVTPAIGATNRLFGSSNGPMRMGVGRGGVLKKEAQV
jgi:hypothetical protein